MRPECDTVSQQLPWLVNGTLPDPEATAAREHLADCTNCRQALVDTYQMLEIAGQHLTPDQVLDRAAGAPSLDPAVDSHLENCAACRDELAMARESRQRLEPSAARVVPFAASRRGAVAPAWRAAAIAASFLGVVALGGWWSSSNRIDSLESIARESAALRSENADVRAQLDDQRAKAESLAAERERLQSELTRQAAPLANVPIIEIAADGSRRGVDSATTTLLVTDETGSVVVVLAAAPGIGCRRCTATLTDAAGQQLWRGDGLIRQPTDDYTLTLPLALLPSGRLTLELTGAPAGADRLRYTLVVLRAGDKDKR